jgi:hypothetical protein
MDIPITVLSSLLSGIIGVVISTIYYRRYERRKEKVELIKQLFGNRYNLNGDKFSEALNNIMIIFNDSSDVLEKLKSFHNIVSSNNKTNETVNSALIDLFKALLKNVRIDFKGLNDTFILKAFNIKI